MDELQFEVGEIIDVIEYEDPEEQVNQTTTLKAFNEVTATTLRYRPFGQLKVSFGCYLKSKM